MTKIPVSELIITPEGQIYHLGLLPEEIASSIFLVGDPKRVDLFRPYFDTIQTDRHKREFRTLTGICQGQRMSVVSTGIGTDNIDIVLTELDALLNIDFHQRSIKPSPQKMHLLRLGTCGILNESLAPGTFIHSRYAIGADGLMHYYPDTLPADFHNRLQAFHQQHCPQLRFYPAMADPELDGILLKEFPQIVPGITFTANGFYAPQGRSLHRIPLKYPTLIDDLNHLEYQGVQVLNMEMESAGLLGLGRTMGHHTGCVCVGLANRKSGEFAENPHELIQELVETGIEIMLKWTTES